MQEYIINHFVGKLHIQEAVVLIFFGRLLMMLLWGFLLWNLLSPYPRPLNIFINVALVLTVLLHGLQMLLFKATQDTAIRAGSGEQPLSSAVQWRLFLFGVFEVLAMQRQQKIQQQKSRE